MKLGYVVVRWETHTPLFLGDADQWTTYVGAARVFSRNVAENTRKRLDADDILSHPLGTAWLKPAVVIVGVPAHLRR